MNKITTIDQIDTSLYDKYQMEQIRWGLKHNLNVSIFADPKYNYNQMRAIRWGLEHNLNVSLYADPKYNENQMNLIRCVIYYIKER